MPMSENYFFVTFVVLKNFDCAASRFIWEEKKLKCDFPEVYEYLDEIKSENSSKKVKKETIEKILLLLER